jgi:hypothetical protein
MPAVSVVGPSLLRAITKSKSTQESALQLAAIHRSCAHTIIMVHSTSTGTIFCAASIVNSHQMRLLFVIALLFNCGEDAQHLV